MRFLCRLDLKASTHFRGLGFQTDPLPVVSVAIGECLKDFEQENNMVSSVTRFLTIITLIIVAQVSLTFSVGKVSSQSRRVMAHSAPMVKTRSVTRTNVQAGPCIETCRAKLRECYRPSGNSPRLRDQCVKSYTSCRKKCESEPPSKTQPQPKPGSVGESSSSILCKL